MGSGAELSIGTALALCLASGCYSGAGSDAEDGSSSGVEGSDSGSDGTSGEPVDPEDEVKIAPMGARRLSRHEYDNVLESLIGDGSDPGSMLLPEDSLSPFDNDIDQQIASLAYVEAAEAIGREAAQRLIADAPRLDGVVGCNPASSTDTGCMESFVGTFGRRALRRPLTGQEVDAFVALGLQAAADHDDFHAGVAAVVSAFLLDTEFIYRVERGTPVDDSPGVFKLDGYEVATRLSFFLLGTTPSDELLDAAGAGELDTEDGVRGVAEQLLASGVAVGQVDRFHALWLGYHKMPVDPDLAVLMRRETQQLLESVVFGDQASWLDVFRATGTFVGDELARHYGLPEPGTAQPTWVEYGGSGRAGLLSHGTFLSVGGFSGETSPTKRGQLIRTRLMCDSIPPPPPDVDADAPPPADPNLCKEERYVAHRENPSCAACHQHMDPLGFGLENYDYDGQYRSHDPAAPACEITGDGEISGVGTFNGPGELAALLVDNDLLDACAVAQLYRYAMGRQEDDAGVELINELAAGFEAQEHRFDRLLVELVAHPAFRYRREEG